MSEERTKTEAAASKDPPAGIEGLLASPELLRTLGTMIGNFSKPKDTSGAPSPTPPPTDGLSALLSSPDFMEKLPGIIETLAPVISGLQAPPHAEPPKSVSAPTDRSGCRDRLLLSLKPFLSQKRCDAIDTMLRIAALSQVLGQMK